MNPLNDISSSKDLVILGRTRCSKSSLFSFLLSLFIHLGIILLFCFGLFHFSSSFSSPPETTPVAPPEVVFDLSPSPPETEHFLETAAEHPLQDAPKNPAFESHENTEAASELPATGTAPLPTQEGRETDVVTLKNSDTTGRTKPVPTAEPEAAIAPANTAAQPTPPPVVTPAVTAPLDRPVMGTLSSQAKAKGEESGSHPSVIHGNISNKGKSSAAAEATPIGRYKKLLADAISSHWYYSIDQRMELLSFGTASVFFYVNQQGKVEELRIVSNTSNQTFADCCLQSITGAKLPSIPPEIAKTLEKGRLEIEYRFTIYPDSSFGSSH